MRRPDRSLEARIAASFAGLVLAVLVAVASVAYTLQRRSLEANALERLSAVVAVKEGEINRWVANQQDRVVMLAGLSGTRHAAGLLADGTDPASVRAALQGMVDRGAKIGRGLQEMFLLSTSGGQVLASSAPDQIGSYHVDELFYEEGRTHTFVTTVYPSLTTARPTLTVSTPVYATSGEVVAVLGAHLNLNRLDDILQATETVGSTAIAYAVSTSNDVISAERFGLPRLNRGIHTEGAERVVRGEQGQGVYDNFDGRPVLGAYRWIPEREIGLVLEMDRSEALAPARSILLGILGVGILATITLLLGVARIGHRVALSLAAVSKGADEVANGAFDVTVPVHGEDEVGHLARSFNAMTVRLRDLWGDLQGQIQVNEHMLLALEESRALLQAIVQNSSTPIAVYHPEAGLALANRALEEALGVTGEKLAGRCLADFLAEEPGKIHLDARSTVLAENRTVEGELRMTANGESRTYFAVWFPLRDAQGAPFSVGMVATDISERIQAEDERSRYEAQLRHAQKLESLGVLAGGIAHDFNNILAAILGHADLALEVLDEDTEATEHIGQVVLASQRAATLTNQMLAYAGRASLQVTVLDLNQAVQEVWSLLSVSMDKKIRLEQELSPKPCYVRADPAQVSQIVMNLVTNAGQAIGDGTGVVTVRTSPEVVAGATVDGLHPGRYVRLTVRDTGCGMDEDTRERMFDPFFTTKESGRGLGLAAVIGIVKGLGGGIRVDSVPGRGTSFEILLPEATEERKAAVDGVERTPRGQGATVLLADDEEAVRRFARRILERGGNTVLEAGDGIEALRRYDEEGAFVSAAVLDVSMPGLGGREVFDELRKRTPGLPVVFTTGYDPADAVRGLDELGGVRFLQKPYRPRALTEALAELLAAEA